MNTKRLTNNTIPATDNIFDNIADEHFIAELGYSFRSLKTLHERMNGSGYPATPEMICERMNEFVEHGRGTIERRGKSWRIVPTGNETDAPVEKPTRTMPPPVCDLGIKQTLNLQHGDCLDLMKRIPDRSVDLILCDPPYGCTKNDYDIPVEMDALWTELRRVIAPRGTIIMFAKQPFSSLLVAAAPDLFKYSMVWQKKVPTGSQLCASQPLRYHEDILVFSPGTAVHKNRSKRTMTYNPQGLIADGKAKYRRHANAYMGGNVQSNRIGEEYVKYTNWPSSVLYFPKDRVQRGTKRHPFAKPVALLEYLIHTYSKPGDNICDPTMGGGSAAIAALNTGRHFVGFELMEKWFTLALERVAEWVPLVPVAGLASNDNAPVPETVAANDDQPVVKPPRKPRRAKAANDDTVANAKSVEIIAPDISLHHGDCLEVMRSMPSGSFDGIVTSPPYNKAHLRKGRGRTKGTKVWNGGAYDGCPDDMTMPEWRAWMRDFLSESWRLLADDGAIFFNYKSQIIDGVMTTAHDFKPDEVLLRQVICWDRGSDPNSSPTYFQRNSEAIYVFAKPGWKCAKTGLGEVWRVRAEMNNDHPAPFPVEIPLRCIRATKGSRILDPFSGSGTTGVAAIREGRSYTGIEQSRKYLDKSKLRLLDELKDIAA